MRILVLTNFYPPHAFGGYELSCRDVVDRWRRAGHEVLVLTSTVRLPDGPAADDDGVRRVLRLYWDDHRILDPPPWRRVRTEAANQAALAAAVGRFRPDVASVWNMGAVSLGLLSTLAARSVPSVLVVCDEWPVYGPHVDAFLRPLLSRPRLAAAVAALTGLPTGRPPLDTVGPAVFVSGWLRDAVRARSAWSFPQAAVVPSGIDPDDFPPAPAGPPRPFGWQLLYVGRVDPRKGLETAVDALARCPPAATLTVVGRGDDAHRRQLEARARRLGLEGRLRFTAAPRAELAACYRRADAVVFPSAWEEPFGLVPLEAMACGTPVVAVPSGGSAEFLVDGRNCLAVAPGDPAALADALGRLAAEPALAGRLRAGGRATAAELDVDRLAEALEAWHRHAAGRGPRPPARPAIGVASEEVVGGTR